MNKILLVGNGFDLAHDLLTKYEHFLYLLKNWEKFYLAYEIARRNGNKRIVISNCTIIEEWNEEIDIYLENVSQMDKSYIDKLCAIVNSNSWIKYYCNCEAEIDGWIDFEREIYPVIDLFEFVFKSGYVTIRHGGKYGEAHIDKGLFSPNMLRTARLWGKYLNISSDDSVCVKAPYVSLQYGILKKKILEDLRKEFDEFILAFEIYLHEFVYRRDKVKVLKEVKDLNITTVISFNYTLTEQLYGIQNNNIHHIHGMIRDDLSYGINNMVMGVNEQNDSNMDFIYFVKYFQRIQKASGVKYKELIQKKTVDDNVMHKGYILYIYGHSLAETDEDILKYVIGEKDETGRLKLKPKKVVIFYYNSADFEQKVVNLIRLYGRSIVEEYKEKELFEFILTNNKKVD